MVKGWIKTKKTYSYLVIGMKKNKIGHTFIEFIDSDKKNPNGVTVGTIMIPKRMANTLAKYILYTERKEEKQVTKN